MAKNALVVSGDHRFLKPVWVIGLIVFVTCSGKVRLSAQAANIVVSLDRTTQDWSDLAMSGPAADDDADASQNSRSLVRYMPRHGKPHADAGAIGLKLPGVNYELRVGQRLNIERISP